MFGIAIPAQVHACYEILRSSLLIKVLSCVECIPSYCPLPQGPCVQNQEALAHSRLLDAVSGFLHMFAILQRKLYRDTSQMELLRELLSLQEEMFILLLSMMEGPG